MRFSIITVSFCSGEKLKETLLSVAKQTCTDYEVIVKDGGSTDGSTDFLKARKHIDACDAVMGEEFLSRVHFFEGEDKGIYDAMNQGYRLASGDVIVFFNDVFVMNDAVSRMMELIQNSPGCVGAHADLVYAALKRNPKQTKEEVSKATGLSRATITRTYSELEEQGKIHRVGSNKTGYWEVK